MVSASWSGLYYSNIFWFHIFRKTQRILPRHRHTVEPEHQMNDDKCKWQIRPTNGRQQLLAKYWTSCVRYLGHRFLCTCAFNLMLLSAFCGSYKLCRKSQPRHTNAAAIYSIRGDINWMGGWMESASSVFRDEHILSDWRTFTLMYVAVNYAFSQWSMYRKMWRR